MKRARESQVRPPVGQRRNVANPWHAEVGAECKVQQEVMVLKLALLAEDGAIPTQKANKKRQPYDMLSVSELKSGLHTKCTKAAE